MAKSNYTVVVVDLSNPIAPSVHAINCMTMNEASAEFQACVKNAMQFKFASCYNGVHPKPGYSHSLTATDYRLVVSNGMNNSILFYVSIVSSEWATNVPGNTTVSASAPSAPSSPSVPSAPSAPSAPSSPVGTSCPAGAPGPKASVAPSIEVDIGGKKCSIDAKALSAALSSMLSLNEIFVDEEQDEDDE